VPGNHFACSRSIVAVRLQLPDRLVHLLAKRVTVLEQGAVLLVGGELAGHVDVVGPLLDALRPDRDVHDERVDLTVGESCVAAPSVENSRTSFSGWISFFTYAVAAPELVPYLQALQEPFNLNRPALVAALASVGRPDEVAERRGVTVRAREGLAAALAEAGMEPLPSAGNFLLVRHGLDDAALTDGLLRRGLLVRSGAELGLPGWVRITAGPEPLMDRVAAALPEVRADVLAALGS
jgi:hypothetical protein